MKRLVDAHRELAEHRRAPDARGAVPAVAGQERHGVDDHQALDALRLALGEGEPDGAPVVHDAGCTRSTPSSSRKRSRKRVVLLDRVAQSSRACPSVRSRAGRARARRCARRNASQSSELVGTPCRYSGAAPSPAPRGGALRQKTGSPSSSPLCSLDLGHRARIYRQRPWRDADDASTRHLPQHAAARLDRLDARRRARACTQGPRPAARGLRHPADGAARPPDRRAGADGALADHQRPQPRRRLPAPARALADVGGGARRAAGGGRGGDPPGRDLEGQVGAHPGDPARDRRAPSVRARAPDPARSSSLDWLPRACR